MSSLEPFISRQDLTDYLGPDVTADEGALAVVDAACDICRTAAGQSFNAVASDTVTLDGAATEALVLPEYPATKVSTVVLAGGTITDYRLDDRNGLLLRGTANVWGQCWPLGRQNVAVTYDHGYAAEDLPRDVRMVALSIASRLIVQGVAESEGIGDVNVSYGMHATDLTQGEHFILTKYRRTR